MHSLWTLLEIGVIGLAQLGFASLVLTAVLCTVTA
jgi:hypothetical protein